MRKPILFVLLATACGGEVTTSEEAERAYLGLDGAVFQALNLGMFGYNAASSANIDDQSGTGLVSGTIVVGGQVDQGASDNKELRLEVTLDDYAGPVDFDDDGEPDGEEFETHYDTIEGDLLQLDVSLRDVPNGTFEGTFVGTVVMSGYLEGDVTLDLDLEGDIAPLESNPDDLQRVSGSTTVTGTATSDYGTFEVDVTR